MKSLRELLRAPETTYLLEAHDGLSARIVAQAGYPAIWASGLAIASSLGLRDANEASWSQILDVVEMIVAAAGVPVLMDADSGYGDFNSFRRVVAHAERRGVAGVCVEDKLFPKENSFVGDEQPLADQEEFCGKLRAGLDTRTSDEFVVVARTEALVSGRGLTEALRRAEAYRRAGADAILVHSKSRTPSEVLTFAREWAERCPLVIVPTTYASADPTAFENAGISTVIWANHMVRASIAAMSALARELRLRRTSIAVQTPLIELEDLFSLLDYDELARATQLYTPSQVPRTDLSEYENARKRTLETRS
jgi:phosphoenolpyruvate phosphomutase